MLVSADKDSEKAAMSNLERFIDQGTGREPADIVLKGGQFFDLVTGELVASVVAASGVRARPLRQARDWGYQRLVANKVVVLADAAPPPIARVTEAGCASTLAFELSDGDERIVVNCGGAALTGATIDVAQVDADDISHPEKFEVQIRFMKSHPKILKMPGLFTVTC